MLSKSDHGGFHAGSRSGIVDVSRWLATVQAWDDGIHSFEIFLGGQCIHYL